MNNYSTRSTCSILCTKFLEIFWSNILHRDHPTDFWSSCLSSSPSRGGRRESRRGGSGGDLYNGAPPHRSPMWRHSATVANSGAKITGGRYAHSSIWRQRTAAGCDLTLRQSPSGDLLVASTWQRSQGLATTLNLLWRIHSFYQILSLTVGVQDLLPSASMLHRPEPVGHRALCLAETLQAKPSKRNDQNSPMR